MCWRGREMQRLHIGGLYLDSTGSIVQRVQQGWKGFRIRDGSRWCSQVRALGRVTCLMLPTNLGVDEATLTFKDHPRPWSHNLGLQSRRQVPVKRDPRHGWLQGSLQRLQYLWKDSDLGSGGTGSRAPGQHKKRTMSHPFGSKNMPEMMGAVPADARPVT